MFITGAVLGGEQQERVRASGVAVIQKPFDRDELVEVVAHAIHVARRADRDAAPVRQDRTPTPA